MRCWWNIVGGCVVALLAGCQTGAPVRDGAPRASASAPVPPAPAADSVWATPGGTPDSADQPTPPAAVDAQLKISADGVAVGGKKVVALKHGLIARDQFRSSNSFYVKAIGEAVADEMTVARRRRLVDGKPLGARQVRVDIDPAVASDTLLAVAYTLSEAGVKWLTLEVGGGQMMHLRLSMDFLNQRMLPIDERAPIVAPAQRAKETSTQASSATSQLGALGGLMGSGQAAGVGGLGGLGTGYGNVAMGTLGASGNSQLIGTFGGLGLGLRQGRYCDARAKQAEKLPALTHVVVHLRPHRIEVQVVSKYGPSRVGDVLESARVDDQHLGDPKAYPWAWLYATLAKVHRRYPEATTLMVRPHTALPVAFVERALQASCALEKASHASPKADAKAGAASTSCSPRFDTFVLSNGHYPRRKDEPER